LKEVHKAKYRKLSLKLNYYRKLKGITQEELAEKLDKSLAFIGAVEAPNVNRTVSLDTLFDIADILEVPVHRFLDFDED
jgi:transcriptional regulator with XRE-family HTH domain